MPVELRQPGASSLVLSCRVNPFDSDRGWKLTHGDLSKVDAPLEEVLPEIGFPIEHVYSSSRCIHPLQGTTFRKGFVTKVATTRCQDTISELAVPKGIICNAYHCGRQFDNAELQAILPRLCTNEPDP